MLLRKTLNPISRPQSAESSFVSVTPGAMCAFPVLAAFATALAQKLAGTGADAGKFLKSETDGAALCRKVAHARQTSGVAKLFLLY